MVKRKEKKRQTNNTMVKRKEKTDKQYHGQKKRQTNNTMVERKEKTDKQCHGPWYCLSVFSFDHGIVCLSLLFF
jgi:hypothetical protein